MKIFEIKNNLVRIKYDATEDLLLSGFVIIKNENLAFVAQVVHLEAEEDSKFAIVKLIFNFTPEGVVSNYNGAIPSLNSEVLSVNTSELLEILPVAEPIEIGEVAQQGIPLKLDISFLKNKPLISIENLENENNIVNNLKIQLQNLGKKLVIFDTVGSFNYGGIKLVAGDNFKLPLNYETINFIYNKGLDGATAETRATIQEIFLEVQNYVKTVPEKFIPFNSFQSVVDDQYRQLQLTELVLLKNKLLKFYEEGVFAASKSEFSILVESVVKSNLVVVDVSEMDESIQREFISYSYNMFSETGMEIYSFVNYKNENSDKKLLKQIYNTKNVNTIARINYNYKYSNELKQLAKDMVFFSPLQQQNDFASYVAFLNKLNPDEFIVYGKSTHNIPFIVKLTGEVEEKEIAPVVAQDLAIDSEIEIVEETPEEILNKEIIKDVDEIYTGMNSGSIELEADLSDLDFDEIAIPDEAEQFVDVEDETVMQEIVVENDVVKDSPELAEEQEEDSIDNKVENSEEELSEDDLDFIDEINEAELLSENEESVKQVSSEQIKDNVEESLQNDLEIENEEFSVSVEPDEENNLDEEVQVEQEEIDVSQGAQYSDEDFIDEAALVEEEAIAQNDELPKSDETLNMFEEALDTLSEQTKENDVDLPPVQVDEAPVLDILPANLTPTPVVPVYSGDIPQEETVVSDEFEQGDIVMHNKYGRGKVEKMISYGSKKICSIQFENVGRRLLDPTLSELKKV